MNTTHTQRVARRNRVAVLARQQSGVVHRRQLYRLGLTRSQVKAELRARRWRSWGRQTIAVHTGPLSNKAIAWRAVFETGADAALDGVSALIDAGLEHFDSEVTHISVSKGATYRRSSQGPRNSSPAPGRRPGHRTAAGKERGRRDQGRVVGPDSRQAAFVLILVAQQGLATPTQLFEAFAMVKRDRRRRFIAGVLADILGGVQSMGELDFARLCRQRDVPEPDRQVRRRLPDGRAYVDVYWDKYRVVVEIEGVQHLLPGITVADSVRQNWLTIDNDTVLRIPVLGLRIAAAQFMDQVESLLRDRGWKAAPPAA